MIERCKKCNANLAMVGISHRCIPMPEWAGGVAKSSSGAKGQPQMPAGSKTADGLARNSSDGGGESRPTERQVVDSLHSAGREKSKRSEDSGKHVRARQVGAKVQAGPQSLKITSDGVAPIPSETKSKRGRPRIGEQRAKPWLDCKPPMSKTTWYRRQAEKK